MELLTPRLLRDDPHTKSFLNGDYDGVTAKSRWVVHAYTKLLVRRAHLVYDELEKLAAENGIDPKRLMWPFQKDTFEVRFLPVELRAAAQGAFAMLSFARTVTPGWVAKAVMDIDEVRRVEVSDRMTPPYSSGNANIRAILLKFSKWARYSFRNRNLLPAWETLSKKAAKDITMIYLSQYGDSLMSGNGMTYLLWDIQEGLLRAKSPFPLTPKARRELAYVFRWAVRLRMFGRTQPVIG